MSTDVAGLVLRSELPAILGVTKGRVGQLARGGQLPAPRWRTVGGAPVWRLEDVEEWNERRLAGR